MKSCVLVLFAAAFILFGVVLGNEPVQMSTHGVKSLHVKLASLDVEHSKHIMNHRKDTYERLKDSSVVPSARVVEQKFLYEQSKIDHRKVCLLLELTEKTGEYYGLGPRKVP